MKEKKINSESEKEKKAAAKAKRMKNLKPFEKGKSGNPNGRPKGSISPITKIRQIFESDPQAFDKFVVDYMQDPANRKHFLTSWACESLLLRTI